MLSGRPVSPVPFPLTSSPPSRLRAINQHQQPPHTIPPSPSSSSSARPISWSLSSISQLTLSHSPLRIHPSSLSHTSPLLLSSPPSPVPRDDVIEGMSLSTGSIFERDVESVLPPLGLDAQQATQLAIPPVLDQAAHLLSITDHPQSIIIDQPPIKTELHNRFRTLSKLFNPAKLYQSPSPSSSKPERKSNRSFTTSNTTRQHRTRGMIPFKISTLPTTLPAMNPSSDTATISGPSSPRSLSPTPSFGIGRSIINSFSEPELNSKPAQNNFQNPIISHQPRQTRLSFMSYADLINSERFGWARQNSCHELGCLWLDPISMEDYSKDEAEVLSE
ncbi:hypothetical protein BY996DRAFT_6423334 [Phakopsora pachyrhizi]|uniref:Expressed protein n=1 Tax=Phakopsora pachyrhizi TaxID=170000 RepID=A0AAV0AE35_PHAPC|nr:hypothetical protein BY996DRAFT_6423334 [Phakopsora pachyrhizi]CAH7666337.1 expressed protein [Phakopsora pachyrhizi]